MRRSLARVVLVALVAALGLYAEAAVASAGPSEKTSASAPDKKKKKKATITVKPSSGLTDGEEVTVSGKYHPKNADLGITQCADKGDETAAGDCNLGGIVVAKSNKKGVVKPTKVKVALGPFGENNIVCTDPATAPDGCLLSLGPLAEGGQHPSKAIKFAAA
jgi:Neocarzinostatin family